MAIYFRPAILFCFGFVGGRLLFNEMSSLKVFSLAPLKPRDLNEVTSKIYKLQINRTFFAYDLITNEQPKCNFEQKQHRSSFAQRI